MGVHSNMDKVLGLVFCCGGGLLAQQGVPHYLASTFFGSSNRISVPQIPNSIRGPALNAPSFIPLQQSFSQQPQVSLSPQVPLAPQVPLSPQVPLPRPLSPALPNVRPEITLSQQGQPGLSQFSGVGPNTGSLPGTPFVNLGQPAPAAPAAPAPLQQGPAGTPPQPEPEPLRKGKAIESRPASGSFNQFGPGPDGPLKESLGQALDEASKSVDFSIPPSDSPGGRSGGPPLVNRPRPGPSSDFPQRQTLSGAPRAGPPRQGPPSPSGPPPSSPVLDSFNQFRAGGDQAQISLQESLGQALDKASKSAQFSLPGGSSPGQGDGGASFTRQGPSSIPQRSGAPFPQRLDSPALQSSRPSQFSSRPSASGIPSSPQLDLEEALNKASEEALGRPGLGGGPRGRPVLGGSPPGRPGLGSGGQFSVIPAVPSGPPQSAPLLEEVNLGSPASPGPPPSSGSNLFRGNTGNPSSPLIRQQSNRSPSRAQSGPPRVFDATPSGSGLNRQPFRSDPKISEQRITQSSKPSNSKIFLGSTRVSESPRSSSLALNSGRKTERIPVKSCTKTFHEECHNEYKMVCEETFTEKEKYECNVVEETKCENGYTTEYEPACFQQILENCENICKRGIQPDCMPQCARSLGKTSCHKVKVVTPHTTCTKVPKEVCANVKKRVPYEKCHDVPKKVCEQVPREVCK